MTQRTERGAAAVEFALVVPLLLVLVLGIVELGRLYHVQAMLDGAAREGVRAMALKNDPAAARAATRAAASPVALTDGQISVTPTSCAGTTGANATVTVTSHPDLLTGFFDSDITLTGKATMRCHG
ncbi:TadE/TadG family type IV pilus assembly protein [Isoptericola sp. NPDC057191]|uniref:TadE/TadG family type IV pilus assembly protein n=1 Tax=Isoptericola sp. NPDC057191 TaxID=3346041 RepID=UPI0036421736